ncbi:MAG: hypothetical protein IJT59_03555 [Desulfovibrionaceae bacterium]|nr:hypothetical protein [Desulfovibrionaceae bacterium]
MSDMTINQTSVTTFSGLNNVNRSPQIAFALLQMMLAKTNKDSAMQGIQEIEAQQAEKRLFADNINAARDLQSLGAKGSATQEEYNIVNVAKDYRDRGWASVPDIDRDLSKFGLQGPPRGSVSEAVKKWDDIITRLEKQKDFNGFCDKYGFKMPSDGKKESWDTLITQIQTKMDTLGADIQTKMVQLQDMMGQYNSYMQGANSAVATSNQTLSNLAKGM